jgi:virginiamycin B lyase
VLQQAGLQLGASTSTVDSPLQSGLIVDTVPAKGTPVKRDVTISFTVSRALPFQRFRSTRVQTEWHGTAKGRDGNFYMTETTTNTISSFTPDGDHREFTVPTPNSQPWGITAGSDGNIWFTEHAASKIGRINVTTGKVDEFQTPTLGSAPAGIAADSSGHLWFAETNANQVAMVTIGGARPQINESKGVTQPDEVAIGADGNVYVSEIGSQQIAQVRPNGQVQGASKALPQAVRQLAAAPDGSIWYIADGFIGRLTFDAQGNGGGPSVAIAMHGTGITVGPDGFIWYSETGLPITDPLGGNNDGAIISVDNNLVQRKAITKPQADLFDVSPRLVINGPGGMLWFVAAEGAAVDRVTIP